MSPPRLHEPLPSRPPQRRAVASLVALGLAWSLLSFLLWRDGAPARAVVLPIRPTAYYGAQALFVGPWLALLATIFALVAGGVARAWGGTASLRATWSTLVPIWALSLLALFVIPDLIVVLALGREHLPRAMRIYAPLAPLVITALSTHRLGSMHAVPAWRALLAVVIALVAQASIGAILLR
jgi:hypothetical protein